MKLLRWLSYQLSVPSSRQQTCKDCWRNDGIDFHVPTPVWNAVAKPTFGHPEAMVVVAQPYDREGWPGVLCLECFDRRAEARGIDYSGSIAIMGRRSWLATGEANARVLERRAAGNDEFVAVRRLLH